MIYEISTQTGCLIPYSRMIEPTASFINNPSRVRLNMSEEQPKTALIVVGNPIVEGQLKRALRKRGYSSTISQDGDSAVDQYVQLNPDIVFLALDIPSLDGHLTALEMRESDSKARIVFVSSKGRLAKAEDAAYSSGSVGVLVTPITESTIEEVWANWMGKIPEAPGLSALDALYPTSDEPTPLPPPDMPVMPESPPIPSEEIQLPLSSTVSVTEFAPPPKPKKKRWGLRIFLLLVLVGAGLGGAHYAELIDLNPYLDEIRELLGLT